MFNEIGVVRKMPVGGSIPVARSIPCNPLTCISTLQIQGVSCYCTEKTRNVTLCEQVRFWESPTQLSTQLFGSTEPLQPAVPCHRNTENTQAGADWINTIGTLDAIEAQACLPSVVSHVAIEVMPQAGREVDCRPVDF